MRLAVCQLFIDRSMCRHIAHHVVAINAVHASWLEEPLGQKTDEFIREENVNVRDQNKPPTCPADPNILGDHLIKGEVLGIPEPPVDLRGHLDKPHLAWLSIWRPAQRLDEGRTVVGWVPVHDDQFRREPMPLALADPSVDEGLHPAEQTPAVIIVASRDDH